MTIQLIEHGIAHSDTAHFGDAQESPVAFAGTAAGGRNEGETSGDHNARTLYQHGTLALLVPGLFDGTLSMGELLTHGDTGIGTGEGLDGEIIILHGTPYQVRHDGGVVVAPDSFMLPFANAHWADFSPLGDLEDRSKAELSDLLLKTTGLDNTFFAVTVTGTFKNMHTRACAKQRRPYPSLEHTAQQQRVFDAESTEGTLLAYYSPQVFNGVAVGGFHMHYLADDHTIGGHALDFRVDKVRVAVQRFDTLQEHLPVANPRYLEHDFSSDDITGAIASAES
ncbi:MAG: acetolactate decarboxylase [Bifidobacterium sp.]|jgi:acetolactate decarboxylase|nr:acetolactate decarboxylase [Bifidobacterium sp.]